MIQTLIELLFYKGLTIKRWNNYPRIEDISILDNTGFVIHTALFLSHLEEKNGKKVDQEFIIKKIIFSSFKKLILSDINSATSYYISKIDPSIKKKLENKVYNNVLSLEGPSFIKEDIFNTLNETDKHLELEIIEASKKYTSLEECKVNSRVFPGIYDTTIEEINTHLSNKKKSLSSLNTLSSNPNYKTYLLQIRRLSHSKRWLGKNRKYEISVMAHLVIVTFFSYIIAMFENEHGKNFNVLDFLLRGMYHDIPEAITGDIITPTKSAVPGFRTILEQAEGQMMNDFFFVYVDEDYRKKVEEYILEPFTSANGKYVKHADIFSMLYESRIEVNSKDATFNEIYKNLKKHSEIFQTASSKYILNNCLETFGKGNLNQLLK